MTPEMPKRDNLAQVFYNRLVTAGTTPTPISSGFQQTDIMGRFDTIIFSNDSRNPRSIYFGGPNVTATSPSNGWEFLAGKSYILSIHNDRQLYELQNPLVDLSGVIAANCSTPPVTLPFTVWDLSSCYVIAAAATGLAVLIFKAMYY